jgi:hypothetical protein
MSPVHLHLLLNHVPVVGMLFVVLILAVAFWRRDSAGGRLALVVLVGLAAVTAVVFLSGEPAEDAVEKLAGVSEAAIHPHEEAAKASLIAVGVAGGLALLALLAFWRRPLPRWTIGGALAVTLIVAVLFGWTANLGGRIRHSEIAGVTLPSGDDHSDRGARIVVDQAGVTSPSGSSAGR